MASMSGLVPTFHLVDCKHLIPNNMWFSPSYIEMLFYDNNLALFFFSFAFGPCALSFVVS